MSGRGRGREGVARGAGGNTAYPCEYCFFCLESVCELRGCAKPS